MFKNAIVKRPSAALIDGITSAAELGKPDFEQALKQHDDYIEALKKTGVKVTILDADEDYPDSCFVEDTAVLTKECAIICNPGAESRRGEVALMLSPIEKFFPKDRIEYIESPGYLEGGDVMMVGDHFYIGKSERTNDEGIRQFIAILEKYGLSGSKVPLKEVLHLKTGVNYIENNTLLVAGEFITMSEFTDFNKIVVPTSEAYAANCIWMNDKVIVPRAYPSVESAVRDAGFEIILVDTSEFKKIDGGLSCLSLRFTALT
jgi:dimethylargininase